MALTSQKEKVMIAIGAVAILLYIVSAFTLGDTYRRASFIVILGIIGSIVGFIGFYEYTLNTQPLPSGNPYYVNFHNPVGSGLDVVIVTFSDGSTAEIENGSILYNVQIYATQTLNATGTVSTGGTLNLPYTHSSLLNSDVYYTQGGAITFFNYITFFGINNKSNSAVNIYSRDVNNNVYLVIMVNAASVAGTFSYIGQQFATGTYFTNVVSVNSDTETTLTCNSDGTIEIS